MAYEKMPCLYETERDLIDRLHNTICRYNGKAVYVSVLGKGSLRLLDPVEGKEIEQIKPADPNFDISSPEIGYFNLQSDATSKSGRGETPVGAYYAERRPWRKYRQGLYPDCVSIFKINGETYSSAGWNQLMKSRGFIDMIDGKFPSLPDGLSLISVDHDDAPKSVAISRDLAVERERSGITLVYCCGVNVGYILPGETEIEFVKDEMSWVTKKVLERNGIRTNRRF